MPCAGAGMLQRGAGSRVRGSEKCAGGAGTCGVEEAGGGGRRSATGGGGKGGRGEGACRESRPPGAPRTPGVGAGQALPDSPPGDPGVLAVLFPWTPRRGVTIARRDVDIVRRGVTIARRGTIHGGRNEGAGPRRGRALTRLEGGCPSGFHSDSTRNPLGIRERDVRRVRADRARGGARSVDGRALLHPPSHARRVLSAQRDPRFRRRGGRGGAGRAGPLRARRARRKAGRGRRQLRETQRDQGGHRAPAEGRSRAEDVRTDSTRTRLRRAHGFRSEPGG